MNEWNIQSRAHHCQACEQPFADKQPYHTILLDARQDYLRRDLCPTCWERDYQNRERDQGFVSYWHGIYEAPPPEPPEPIQKETAESLLRRLIELNNPKHMEAGFILAVMLERKRTLKVKEQILQNGYRLFVYEHPKTGDLFTIRDPGLRLAQLDAVQRTVAALLEYGLTPEGEIAGPASGPSSGPAETPGLPEVPGLDVASHKPAPGETMAPAVPSESVSETDSVSS